MTSSDREMVSQWLKNLILLVAPNMPVDQARAKVAAMTAVLEGQYDTRIWGQGALRDAAARFNLFPGFAALSEFLEMWASVYRVRDNPAITQRVMGQMGKLERNYLPEASVSHLAIPLGKHLRVVGDDQ